MRTIFREHILGDFGGLERARNNHTNRLGRILNYLVTNKIRKPININIIFHVFGESNSSLILRFSPRGPQSPSFGKPQKGAHRRMIEIHHFETFVGAVLCTHAHKGGGLRPPPRRGAHSFGRTPLLLNPLWVCFFGAGQAARTPKH